MRSTTASAADPGQPAAVPAKDAKGFAASASAAAEDDFVAFPLRVPHEKHYFRAGAEVGGVLAVGFVNYLLFTAASGGLVREGDERWGLRYAWPALRAKLVGSGYELDANNFSTNYVSHPFAGTAYFHVARSNHLSFMESLLFATLGSSTWEYFGEIRERVSVNDMIVTPMAGAAIGETTMQLSGFFSRGRKQFHNRFLAILFSPIKAINELVDGAEPRRSPDSEESLLGFSAQPWHRFEVYGGMGTTIQGRSGNNPSGNTGGMGSSVKPAQYTDVRFGFDLGLVNLPGYGGPAHYLRLFDDGNISSLTFGVMLSQGRVVDGRFATRVVPIGLAYRNAGFDSRGRLWGHGGYLGLRMGFDYDVHDYDRDRARPIDFMGIASPLGVAAEYTFDAGHAVRIRTSIDVHGGIASVRPYALSDYLVSRASDDTGLPTAVRKVSYYHAFDIAASPRVEVKVGPIAVDARLRLDVLRPIEGLDPDNSSVNSAIEIRDSRSSARGTIAWEPSSGFIAAAPLRLAIGVERGYRSGVLGNIRAGRSETSMFANLGVLF